MKKISIVGVEGSGKTVLMSVLGEKYAVPDKNGLSLKAKKGETFAFCTSIVAALRKGQWPMATSPGEMSNLEWELLRHRGSSMPKVLGEVAMLDFAGEVYRQAFGMNNEVEDSCREDVDKLRNHVSQSDILVVLVNLKDVIDGDRTDQRTIDMLWLSQSILEFAKEHGVKDVALVLSQADRYKALLEQQGGVVSAFKKYLPNVMYAFPNVSAFEVSAVDGTRIDDSTGKVVPACDFATTGLDKLMLWIKDRLSPVRRILKTLTFISLLAIISVALISSTTRCLLHTNVFTWAYERILMLQGIEDKIKKARYELTALETKCNAAIEDCQRQKKESDRLQIEVNRQRSIAEQLEHNIDKSRAELVRLENKYKVAVEGCQRQNEEFNRLQSKVNNQHSIAKQLEHNIDKSRAELVRLENQYKEAVENHQRQKEEFNRWQLKVNSQRSIAGQLERNIDESRAELVRLENKYRSITEDCQRQQEAVNRFRSIAEDLKKKQLSEYNTMNRVKREQLLQSSGYSRSVENVWVEGRYEDTRAGNGTVVRVWRPGHYELKILWKKPGANDISDEDL